MKAVSDDINSGFVGAFLGILAVLILSYVILRVEDISAFKEITILHGRLDTGIRIYSVMVDTAATDSVYGKGWRKNK